MTTAAQQTGEGAYDAALARITEWQRDTSLPVIPGHTYPRWEVSLTPPDALGPPVRRAGANRRALTAQSDEIYTTRAREIEQAWGAGNLTPNQRAEMRAQAAQEHATRQARLDAALGGLTTEAATQCAWDDVTRAIATTWHVVMHAYITHLRPMDDAERALVARWRAWLAENANDSEKDR